MPRLPRECHTEWETIGRVLNELDDNNIITLGCLPATLLAWPERAGELAIRLRNALQKGDDKGVAGASEAIRYWALLALSRKVPKMPEGLLDELCHRVEVRQLPALDAVIVCVTRVVRETPKIISAKQTCSLCLGLEYLLEETRLPNREERMALASNTSRIPVEQRPRYRSLGAWLAFNLHQYFKRIHSPPPPVLAQWKEVCEQDPLPEVRRQWQA